MLDALLYMSAKLLLKLRYRIRVEGLRPIASRGAGRILFLPNHPALIDPIILLAYLGRPFRPRALAVAHQIDRFFIRRLARYVGVHPFEDPARAPAGSREQVEAAVAACIDDLRRGENVVVYPSGHVYRGYLEDLRGNTAVGMILREVPDVRVVLVRTRGLWGSGFSWASGRPPSVGRVLKKGAWALLAGGVFFAPRRGVTIEFHEPDDLPRGGARNALNEYLERWYNLDAPHHTYVPYTPWERGGPRVLPEPPQPRLETDLAAVPEATRQIVAAHLRERTGQAEVHDGDDLARDLGLDSLARAELLVWLSHEFGLPQADVDALRTVGDAMLAACGELMAAEPKELPRPPGRWFAGLARRGGRLGAPRGRTLTDAFLAQAARGAGRVVAADSTGGARTYRDLLTAIFALRPALRRLAGQRVGILLPASVAADTAYLAALFAGKTPVMVNWTVGLGNVAHCLALAGVENVITSRTLIQHLKGQGTDLSEIAGSFVFLEDLAAAISRPAKLAAWLKARLAPSLAARADIPDTAAILFTSGSEARPKAVPLTHDNLLANIRDVTSVVCLRGDDAMLGALPPFHSFGLTVTMIAPLLLGLRVVHYPNPMDAVMLAQVIDAYKTTLLIGTPTMLGRIVGASGAGQLSSLRLAVTGAEKCPQRVYDALAERCPHATVLEGYGVTECSPIISVTDERAPRPLTIGRPLPSVELAVVDLDAGRRAAPGQAGMLLVRGPSVFAGYLPTPAPLRSKAGGCGSGQAGLSHDAPQPFVEFEGLPWYRTGDLVSLGADGVMTFHGRLKRFVKIGGEMISLPAVEAALEPHLPPGPDEKPSFAVTAGGEEDRPELVLFATRQLDRPTVNAWIRDAGLSPLHNIRRIVTLEALPLLGTGKVDYRALEARPRQEG